MTLRVCTEPGCPTLIPQGARGGRCPTHQRVRDRARGTRADRGYDWKHQRTAQQWRQRVAQGERVTCWRCGNRIVTPGDLHLGHDDNDRSITRGPEHALCNLVAAGRKGAAADPGG